MQEGFAADCAGQARSTVTPVGYLQQVFDRLGQAQDSAIMARNKMSELGFYPNPAADPGDKSSQAGESNLRNSLEERVNSLVDLCNQIREQTDRLG